MLCIVSGSVLITLPSLAQSPVESFKKKIDDVSAKRTVNLDKVEITKSKLENTVDSKAVAQSKPPIDKPNRQQPVFSRIFPVMTMQQ